MKRQADETITINASEALTDLAVQAEALTDLAVQAAEQIKGGPFYLKLEGVTGDVTDKY